MRLVRCYVAPLYQTFSENDDSWVIVSSHFFRGCLDAVVCFPVGWRPPNAMFVLIVSRSFV